LSPNFENIFASKMLDNKVSTFP